jgi:putative transposase
MKKTRFSESQIVSALKSYESGKSTDDICRELGINRSTFYYWKKRYGGMEVSQLKELKELQEKHSRLQKMYSELSMDHQILKEIIEKKL